MGTNDVPEFSEVKNNELFQYNDEMLINTDDEMLINTDCYLMSLFTVHFPGQDEAVVYLCIIDLQGYSDGLFFVII